MKQFQPRYVSYAHALMGCSPEEQLKYDKKKYPGGCMCVFQAWILKMWKKYKESGACLHGFDKRDIRLSDHDHFTLWLSSRYE